jgi:hypothetical protein
MANDKKMPVISGKHGGALERNQDWWTVAFIVVLLVILTLPRWPYSRTWGSYPAGILMVVLFILIVLLSLQAPPVTS